MLSSMVEGAAGGVAPEIGARDAQERLRAVLADLLPGSFTTSLQD